MSFFKYHLMNTNNECAPARMRIACMYIIKWNIRKKTTNTPKVLKYC